MISSCAPGAEIIKLERVEISVKPWSWDYAVAHRQEINQYFALRQSEQPALWNGRTLLLRNYAIRDGVLHGSCFETDYASLLACRDWNFPDPTVYNVFAAGALQAADGAYLVGEMALHTASPGGHIFPCGTPEPRDVDADGSLDLFGNLRRELQEETGIEIGELEVEPGWTLVRDRGFVGLMRRLVARDDAQVLRSRILRHIANEQQSELSDVRIVRGATDLDARMPLFVVAFLQDVWRQ
jgi:hypothetical protein